jgi:HPr kinase/phosphorylase
MSVGSATGARRVLVHATAVVLLDAAKPFGGSVEGAVLLTGEPGAGKSDVALRLIAAGAKLISDDQTILFVEQGRVWADAAPTVEGVMEIRGIGIMRVERAPPSPVVLAVRLTEGTVARMPEPDVYALPVGLQADVKVVPLIMLNAREASTPAKIAASALGIARGGFVAGAFPLPSTPFL